jgi:hypothetical protein
MADLLPIAMAFGKGALSLLTRAAGPDSVRLTGLTDTPPVSCQSSGTFA